MIAATLALGLGAGCIHRDIVEVVRTATRGVAYVIADPPKAKHKAYAKDAEGRMARSDASYILLCDGRYADGMHCDVVEERARERVSVRVPARAKHVDEVPENVGVLTGGENGSVEIKVKTTSKKSNGAQQASGQSERDVVSGGADDAGGAPSEAGNGGEK